MDIINDDKNLDDIEHHIKGLELKNFQLINENNRLKMSINYLIENMKHFIDNNNQIFPELVQFCEEAKLLIVDDDEAKSESEDTRRENQYKDYQGRENEFSSISLDPYYNSNNIAANTNSLQPKSDVNEFDLQKLSDLRYDKSTFCRKESCMVDDTQIKFLEGLNKNCCGYNLSMSRNAVKQSTEPITISNIKTFKNSHGISVIPNTKQEKIEIRKNISPIENDHRSKIKEISLKDNQEKEVLGKINKDLEENSSKKLENCTNSYANKLFEHFIIIGADPNDLEQTNENNLKNATINPKILYDFDCDKCKVEKKDEKTFYGVLPIFCFPFGVKLKKIQPEKRHQIVTKNYTDDCPKTKERCFIVTFNTENTYNQNYGSKILESINPHHILYCISMTVDDYICTSNNKFWMIPKVYTILTYYPFPNLFFQLLIEMTKEIKLRRLESIYSDEKYAKGKMLDNIIEIFESDFKLSMEHMSRYLIPKNISSPIILNMKFKYNQENIIFNFPQEDLIQFQSFLWCSPLVFSNIPFEDFRFLLYALMLEKHIAFVSINLTLLTSTVLTFFHIMKPILWVDPMIISLNESMLDYIDAPNPILLGISGSKKMFTSYRDLTNRSDCLFYLLDENEIIYPDNEIQKILQIFPVFQDIKNDMKNIYKKHFNKMVSHKLQNVILSKFANNTKKLIVNPNKELEEKAKEIFLIIQNRIKLNLIDLLPKLPILISKDELDMEKIRTIMLKKVNHKRDEAFLTHFYQTQNVMYFIQKYYSF